MNITKKELERLKQFSTFYDRLSPDYRLFRSVHRKLVNASRPCEWREIHYGWIGPHHDEVYYNIPNYCPECGRKVKAVK